MVIIRIFVINKAVMLTYWPHLILDVCNKKMLLAVASIFQPSITVKQHVLHFLSPQFFYCKVHVFAFFNKNEKSLKHHVEQKVTVSVLA